MIVVDTSAVVAILLDEPEAASFRPTFLQEEVRISAVSDYEVRVVAFSRRGIRLVEQYATLLDEAAVAVVAFDEVQSRLAFEAYRRYGKGNHPAALNLADCAAYALAKSLDAPLLFKGADFSRTDVRRLA